MKELYLQSGITTRQITPENPTGAKGGACQAVPGDDMRFSYAASKLGKGWKVNPFIWLEHGKTAVLADIEGPGCINEFWITSDIPSFNDLVLRMYWDHEQAPSVEVPLGSFFAMGHDFAPHEVYSAMVTVAPHRGLNCFWQMPFRQHARITLSNEGNKDALIVAYKMLYKLHEVEEEAAYFHAQFRHSLTTVQHPEHVILDGVTGKGVYVGTYVAYNTLVSGWWGEGEVKFFLDGDTEYPTIVDSGTEDYFGGAWNFNADHAVREDQFKKAEKEFHSPYLGMPLAKAVNPYGPRKYSLYRWHVLDSIGFREDLKITMQTLGWHQNSMYRACPADIGSVAYWYQMEPHTEFPQMESVEERSDM